MFQAVANLAALAVERFDLRPPVDIRGLVEKHAYLEYCEWPFKSCDGIALRLEGRPRIFLRAGQGLKRERFTLAHEFGHLMIGWHGNAVDCKPNGALEFSGHELMLGVNQEREANEFASRVLLPDRSIAHLGRTYVDPSKVLETAATAEMSAVAGIIAVSRSLLPGYVFFVEGHDHPVNSPGTRYEVTSTVAPTAVERGITEHQGRKVKWYRLAGVHEPKTSIVSKAEAKRCLQSIAQSHIGQRLSGNLVHRVNGVIGAVMPRLDLAEPQAVYGALVHRFASHDELAVLLDVSDFRSYLAFRAHERVRSR
ncbi:ImmA/IrrE family metallo-endopeptidase [Saccharomonospora iraqiensis]|uniref:ImmA/IrrE family metallo-endopeptidase n=1 Tax=Saccharomonospora iraqiensis TaxID=52698 RepID=UPI00022E898C|nr:ImmA/IrrE family metallo-endopeptidase [Saccharomonospora iraqiensis]